MGRIYRPVEISANNKKKIVIAIIDTGADETLISQKLADEMGARLYGEFLAICASKTLLKGKYADVLLREIWSKKQTTISVGVSDIPFHTDDIDEEGIDVIVGVDFIQKTKLRIEM